MFKREGSLSLFRKPAECYFCGTPCPSARLSSPSTASGKAGYSFRCTECQSYNRYDHKGRIISDDPAMHDEAMNTRSFARRASPRKNRLPSEYTSSNLFCQNCKTNQTLLMNLRASFLPHENDPEYERRLAQWPAYEQSLYARYPPVCEKCEDNVSKEIARKDNLARSTALGGFLKDSRSKDRTRTAVPPRRTRVGADKSLLVWYIRGVLWVLTTLSSLVISGTLAFGSQIPNHPYLNSPLAPSIAFLSLIWTFWDPGYLSARKAQRKGKYVRSDQRRRSQYIRLQGIAWTLRLLSSSLLMTSDSLVILPTLLGPLVPTVWYFSVVLVAELMILALSFMTLRPGQAPQVQLHDRHNSQSRSSHPPSRFSTPLPSNPATPEADLLAPLSLSGHPVLPSIGSGAHNPVFGAPSLHAPLPRFQSAPTPTRHDDDGDAVMVDEDAMDWQPASPQKPRGPARSNDDASWIRPQRFFAPEQPTGLESLLERTGLSDSVPASSSSLRPAKEQPQVDWGWVYACALIIVMAIWVYLWVSYSGIQEAKIASHTVHPLPLLIPSSGTAIRNGCDGDPL